MSKDKELRNYQISELRFDEQNPKKFRGYAAVFNSETELWEGFKEKIAPGAFSDTVKKSDIRCLFNHNSDKVLGRSNPSSPTNTLLLREDEKGLYFECEAPDTTYANDLKISMERGDIDKCSFGFYVKRQNIEWNAETDVTTRTLLEVELFDVSIVTYPAYDDTIASLRSKIESESTQNVTELNKIRLKKLDLLSKKK